MGLYRSTAVFSGKTLDELFRAGDLESDDAHLRIVYTLTQWKRHTVTLHHRAARLSDYLALLARRGPVRIDVERSEKLAAQRYVLRDAGDRAVLEGVSGPTDTAELETIEAARVRTGRTAFKIARGECLFAVSGYDRARLSAKFARTYVMAELELPELTEQTWVVLGRPV